MRDFDFVTEGYLSKEYFIEIAKRCGLEYAEDKELNSLIISEVNADSSFNIYLNSLSKEGKVIYDDQEEIEEELKSRIFRHLKQPVMNSIDYASPCIDLVVKFVKEIQKDYPEIYFRGNDEKRFKKF